MIKLDHFKTYIIEKPLKDFNDVRPGAYSEDAVELLIGTAAIESNMGFYLKQVGGGPACGVFQVEPATAIDNFIHYLRYQDDQAEFVRSYMSERLVSQVFDGDKVRIDIQDTPELREELTTNLIFGMFMARIKYLRAPEPLPSRHNYLAMGDYWEINYQGDPSRTIGETAAEFAAAYEDKGL